MQEELLTLFNQAPVNTEEQIDDEVYEQLIGVQNISKMVDEILAGGAVAAQKPSPNPQKPAKTITDILLSNTPQFNFSSSSSD